MKCTHCDGDGWIRTDIEGRYDKCAECKNGVIEDVPRLAQPLRDPELQWLRSKNERQVDIGDCGR